jgi:hypothetical protein
VRHSHLSEDDSRGNVESSPICINYAYTNNYYVMIKFERIPPHAPAPAQILPACLSIPALAGSSKQR